MLLGKVKRYFLDIIKVISSSLHLTPSHTYSAVEKSDTDHCVQKVRPKRTAPQLISF